jgi:hypothetical protein
MAQGEPTRQLGQLLGIDPRCARVDFSGVARRRTIQDVKFRSGSRRRSACCRSPFESQANQASLKTPGPVLALTYETGWRLMLLLFRSHGVRVRCVLQDRVKFPRNEDEGCQNPRGELVRRRTPCSMSCSPQWSACGSELRRLRNAAGWSTVAAQYHNTSTRAGTVHAQTNCSLPRNSHPWNDVPWVFTSIC